MLLAVFEMTFIMEANMSFINDAIVVASIMFATKLLIVSAMSYIDFLNSISSLS